MDLDDVLEEFPSEDNIRSDTSINKRNKNYRVVINDIEFEWDTLKNEITIKKHGVSFEEAAEIFSKEDTVIEYDEDHSDCEEERYNAIGYSSKQRILIVCHCYKNDEIIRIISARKAESDDIALYNQTIGG